MTSHVIDGARGRIPGSKMDDAKLTIRRIRFALSGALMGVAAGGLVSSLLFHSTQTIPITMEDLRWGLEIFGALSGFVAVILWFGAARKS